MARFGSTAVWLLGGALVIGVHAQEKQVARDTSKGKTEDVAKDVSFKRDVFPILSKYCLPCHAEDNANPSELSLDNYELLKRGGRHGEVLVAGNPKESLLINKLAEKPPFGDRMPLNSKKKVKDGKARWLTEEEVTTIATWVRQGAKGN